MVDGQLYAVTTGDDRIPVALFVRYDKVKEVAQVVVLAEECRIELVREGDFLENILHGEAEKNIEQRKYAEQEARVRGESRTLDVSRDEFAELCTQK